MTTAQRVTAYVSNGTFDPELVALYFQFGRYLLIGSSRAGGLPANLQGELSASSWLSLRD